MPSDHFELERWQGIRAASDRWYKNVQLLGAGGNGVAFLAMCSSPPRKGELVAIKVFRRWSKPERRDAFLGETKFLEGAEHPAILRVLDTGVFQLDAATEAPFVVTEYLPSTLRALIRGSGLPIVTKLSYTMQLLSALTYLASLQPPIVHRDIKPENIFIKGGSCVLGDFGLLKQIDGVATEDDQQIVKASIGAGMPYHYRTPDLVAYLRDGTPLTTKTDVFQLGLVLAELFAGWNPHQAASAFTDPIELSPLRWIHGRFGASIAAQIRRMLELDPVKRPAADELIDGWEGIFREAVDAAFDLEGRAF